MHNGLHDPCHEKAMSRLHVVIFLLLVAVCLPLQAEELHAALYFQRDEMTLRSGGADVDTRIGRIGFTLTSRYSDYLEGSLEIAHASMTQSGNPATQGMNPSGEFFGVALRAWPLRSEYLDLWLGADYGLLTVSGSNNGQSTELDWDDAGVSAGLVLHAGRIDLLAGARYADLRGDEVASGTLNYTRSLELEDKTTYWGGADFYVDRTGTIGVLAYGGGRDGFMLRFARRF